MHANDICLSRHSINGLKIINIQPVLKCLKGLKAYNRKARQVKERN